MGRKRIQSKRTPYHGIMYDSKFEASRAHILDIRVMAGEIQSWERQYKLEMIAHLPCGKVAYVKKHKVDFRLLNNDGTYTLLEAKGVETTAYREVLRWINKLWLPLHPDHDYQVVYMRPKKRKTKRLTTKTA